MNPKTLKDDTRALILQAAFEAFAETGYDATTMDDIVKRSGLSKGTLYWYFKNKHDLFVATLETAMGGMDTSFAAAMMDNEHSAAERLRKLFILTVKIFTSDMRWTRLLTNAFFQSAQSTEARQAIVEMYEKYIGMVEQLLQQGIDRGEFRPMDTRKVAIALIGGGDGIVFQGMIAPPWEVISIMEAYLDMALHGLLKEQSSDDSNE